MPDGPRWLSPSRPLNAIWQAVLTRHGFAIFGTASALTGLHYLFDPTRPATAFLAVMAILVAFCGLFVLMALSWVADALAERAVCRILKAPDPSNPLHQALYLALALAGFIVAAIIGGMSDPDTTLHLYRN